MTSFAARLTRLAAENPGAPAITCGDRTLSRADLEREAEALARDLAERGVRAGDYVSIVLPNNVTHPVATVATWKLGAVPQPLSPKLPVRELAEIIELTQPALVFGSTDARVVGDIPALAPDYQARPVEPGLAPLPDLVAPSWKAATSGGSTGKPKVILAGQPGIYERVGGYSNLLQLRSDSTALVTAPLSHNGPFMVAALTLLAGGHAVLMPRFDAEELLRLVDEHQVTFVYAVPTMMTRILKLSPALRRSFDVSSIETWVHMGGPCPPEVKDAWLHWLGPEKVLEVYAGTEAQAVTLINGVEWLAHRGSVGRPVVGEIDVRDADGKPCSPGEVGRVWLRRPAGVPVTYEYLGAEAIADADGWESLGDMGSIDEEGFLYLTGREGDMILVGGANVYPAEIESVLMEHPAVLDACVIGLPDEDLGAVPHALVYLSAAVRFDELDEFVSTRVAAYRRPRSYEVVDKPLRDDAGKLRRARFATERR